MIGDKLPNGDKDYKRQIRFSNSMVASLLLSFHGLVDGLSAVMSDSDMSGHVGKGLRECHFDGVKQQSTFICTATDALLAPLHHTLTRCRIQASRSWAGAVANYARRYISVSSSVCQADCRNAYCTAFLHALPYMLPSRPTERLWHPPQGHHRGAGDCRENFTHAPFHLLTDFIAKTNLRGTD